MDSGIRRVMGAVPARLVEEVLREEAQLAQRDRLPPALGVGGRVVAGRPLQPIKCRRTDFIFGT